MRILALLSILLLGGCVYEAPLTPAPTRAVEARLIGDWTSPDGRNRLKVRRLDEDEYVVSLNGFLFHAWHSEVGGAPLATLRDIDTPERRHAFVAWRLSEDGSELRWRAVSRKAVPDSVKTSAELRSLVERGLGNPALFEAEQVYARKATRQP